MSVDRQEAKDSCINWTLSNVDDFIDLFYFPHLWLWVNFQFDKLPRGGHFQSGITPTENPFQWGSLNSIHVETIALTTRLFLNLIYDSIND